VTRARDVSLEAQRARKRRNSKAARERRKRGQYRRTLTIPGAQFRRLAELGYLERIDDPVAQVRALEAFLFDSLPPQPASHGDHAIAVAEAASAAMAMRCSNF
jgi:hypothetical protein